MCLGRKTLLGELSFPAQWWDAKGSVMSLIRYLPWEISCLSWSQLVTKLKSFPPFIPYYGSPALFKDLTPLPE